MFLDLSKKYNETIIYILKGKMDCMNTVALYQAKSDTGHA